jgi:hypothetical protein
MLGYVLGLVYGIFMLIYLKDAKKCDKYLSKRDQTFRKVAYYVTWVDVVLTGLAIIFVLFGLLGIHKKTTCEPLMQSSAIV